MDYPDLETGGDFFGFWNNLGLPVILYVSGPGENSYRNSSFFRQDLDFLVGVGNYVYTNFGLQHIGSWHSHNKLSLAIPSSHDCTTMINAVNNNTIDKFFMILGNITNKGGTTINGFLFDKYNQTNYSQTQWRVLKSENLLSKAINRDLKKTLLYKPKTRKARLEDLIVIESHENKVLPINFESTSWLASQKGRDELKVIFQWFENRYENAKMYLSESNDLELRAYGISIIFNNNFPQSHPIITTETNLTTEMGVFEYENEKGIIDFITSKIESNTLGQ